MKKRTFQNTAAAALVSVLMLTVMLTGCGKTQSAAVPAASPESAVPSGDAVPHEDAVPSGTEAGGAGADVVSSEPSLLIPGTWQTVSMAYLDDGTLYPEYYVRFTDSDILYGHLKDGQFELDHADHISIFEETSGGGLKVKALASNGVQYTYQTCESDRDVLEYYETWREEEFAEMYRGGASLGRCSD